MLDHFERLLDKKPLRESLARAIDRWAVEMMKERPEPIIRDFDALARGLTRLFDVRHVLCHEVPKEPVYVATEIEGFLDEAIRFTKALEEVLTFERFGLLPLTQKDLNIAADNDLIKKEDELKHLLAKIRTEVEHTGTELSHMRTGRADGTWLHCLDDAHEKWLSYRNAHCDFETFLNLGGSSRPMLWSSEASRMTDMRIAQLRSWMKRELESR